jgi:hypothetical protein
LLGRRSRITETFSGILQEDFKKTTTTTDEMVLTPDFTADSHIRQHFKPSNLRFMAISARCPRASETLVDGKGQLTNQNGKPNRFPSVTMRSLRACPRAAGPE